MSRLGVGELIALAILVIACIANLTGAAAGGAGVAIIWGAAAVVFYRWRVNKHDRAV